MTDWNFYALYLYTSNARTRDAFDAFVAGVVSSVGRTEGAPASPLRLITPCPPDIRNPEKWDAALGMQDVVWTHVEEITAPVGRLGALIRFRLPQASRPQHPDAGEAPLGWLAQLEAREYPFYLTWVNEDRAMFGTYDSMEDDPFFRVMSRWVSDDVYRSVVVDCVGPSAILTCRAPGCGASLEWKLRALDTEPEHVAEREEIIEDFGDPRLAKYRVFCPVCYLEDDNGE